MKHWRARLDACVGFDWDVWNAGKNWDLHQVTPEEAEEIFFHEPFLVAGNLRHSSGEKRYQGLGSTSRGRKLFVSFAIRRQLIRVVSVRDMNRREREQYERYEEAST